MHEALRPLGGHAVFLLLVQLALLLVVARLGAELCRRMALPAVVGELAAGIVLGPSVLGHFAPAAFAAIFPASAAQFHLLEVVGTLGMVLLLLLTGIETDLRLLRNVGRAALIASAMGMVVPFVTGFVLGIFTPERYLAQPDRRVLFSFFLATAMAISAMPVIAKILMDLDLTKRNIGVVILSAGVVDDTAGWLVLSVIAGAASQGSVDIGGLARTVLLTVAFVGGAVFVVYPLSRWLLRAATRSFKSQDADLVLLLVIAFLCAAATEWIGIHAVFGAFVAGTLLRQVPSLRSETVHRLESFVFGVLAPIFFGTVGLKVNLWTLGGGGMLAIVLGFACFGKLFGCTLGSVWGGLRFWEGLSIAVAMNARGAMELVVATIGLSLGILNQQMFSIIVMVAIVTSFMAPVGLRLTMRKVRMTDDEARRILGARAQGAFDPTRVRVLAPSAGGPNAVAALRLAAGIGRKSAHPPEVLQVKEPESWRDSLTRLLGRMRRATSNGESGITRQQVEAHVPRGELREVKHRDAARAIVAEARKGFDFVVLGASRRGRWLGGPTLEDVVRAAPCHLAIVKAGASSDGFRHLLVPFDGGVFSRLAVEFALRYAELTDAELTVAAIEDTPSGTGDGTDSESLERISPLFRAVDLKPKLLRVLYDPNGEGLSRLAASGQHDLVIIGTENRAVQNRLFFGRDAERLLREAQATVAIVVPHVTRLA